MRKRVITITLAVAATGGAVLAGAPAAQALEDPAPDSHKRSSEIRINNWTGCTLELKSATLEHGKWAQKRIGDKGETAAVPPRVIKPFTPDNPNPGEWKSASEGFMTGTEGRVEYVAKGCELEGKSFKYHWDNAYVGDNSQDSDGSDPAFEKKEFGGRGNHAQTLVDLQIKGQQRRAARPAVERTPAQDDKAQDKENGGWLFDWTFVQF